jgi:hypothetical protein
MNTIKTNINGEPFEIEIGDGCEVLIEGNKITVRSKPAAPIYVQGPPVYIERWTAPPQPITPYNPYAPFLPTWPTIICGDPPQPQIYWGTNTTVTGGGEGTN